MQRPISRPAAYAKVSFVMCAWGFSFVASKYAMQAGFGEFTLAFVRYIFVCLVMMPLLRIREGGWQAPSRADLPGMIVSGVLGITLYFVCEYMGVMRTTVANASLVLAAIPIFSILWGALRGRRYAPACWLGVGVSMLGVFLVGYAGATQDGGGLNRTVIIGNLLLLGACVCWVAYIEISNRLLTRYSSLSVTAWQGLFGLIGLLPLALSEGPKWQNVPPLGWGAAFFLALVCSALGFFWYAQGITALSPIQAAIFVNLTPVVAVVAGVLLLGESFSGLQLAGGLMIIGSILLVNLGMTRRAS